MRSTDYLKYEAIKRCNIYKKCSILQNIQVTTHTCNMGRHKTMTCNVCFKSMRGDNLKKHMKKHERENANDDNVLNKGMKISYTHEKAWVGNWR